MSTLLPYEVPCPRCGAVIHGLVADSVHANRTPWVRANLLDGRLHRFDCPRCGVPFLLEKELLYLDFERRHFVGVFPPADQPRFLECSRLVEATFVEATRERAPKALARYAEQFTVRLVFGLAELREKLLAWDLGLDDRILELLKLDLLAQHPALTAAGLQTCLLDGSDHGALIFVPRWSRAPVREVQALWIDRRGYDEAAAAWPRLAPQHAELAAGPYVSIGRYFAPPAPAVGTPRSSSERKIWRPSRP